MKKGLLGLSALFALALVACNGNNPTTPTSGNTTPSTSANTPATSTSQQGGSSAKADTVEPEISGNVDLTCSVEDTINLLEGITAVDDVDGDISSKVTVTTLPELTVTNGTVTPMETGDYEVQYKVTDAAGNVGEAFCTLTVNPKLAEKEVYLQYNFGVNEDLPFSVWSFGEGADQLKVDSTINKGLYVVAGKTDGEAWHVKFESKLDTQAGADYKVKYDFMSNVAGNVTFEAYGLPANRTEEIHVGANSLEFSFTATEAKEQGICLQLGALPTDFEVGFSRIEFTQSVGQDVWKSLLSDFAFNGAGVVTSAFDNNSAGSVVTTADSATLNITRGSDENGVWQTKLFVKPGVDLEKDKKYRISVDVEAEKAIDQFEICYNNGDVEKGVGALYSLSVGAGVKGRFEFVVTPDTAKDNLVLQFQLGKQNTLHDSNVVTVSNLKVEEIVLEDEELVQNHTFVNSDLGSHFWSDSVGTFTASDDNSKAVLNVTKGTTTPNVWELYAEFKLGVALEANRDYTISFDMKSTAAIGDEDHKFEVLPRHFGTEAGFGNGGLWGQTLAANATQKFEFTVHVSEDVADGAVALQLGAIQSATVVEISNLQVVAKGGAKEETTEGFEFTPEGFGTYNDAATAEGYLYIEDGKLVYEMVKIGLVDWHNKMYISRLHLEADKIYTIEVVAKADKDISCAFFLNPVGKWDPRVSEEMAFTTTDTEFSFVTPKFAADMDFEVLFQFGSAENQALGGAKIIITSITIYSQDVE